MANRCFMQDCELEVQYLCFCLGSQTYSCEIHLQMHLNIPNRAHEFDSVLVKPCEGDKTTILEFLAKEKSKKEELKKIALAVNRQCCQIHKDSIDEKLRAFDSDLNEIGSLIEKLSAFPENGESSPLNPLIEEMDEEAKRDKEVIATDSELYRNISLFCELGLLRNKKSEILNRANNDRETEQDFRRSCSLYEEHAHNPLFSQAYQEYINAYQKITSTYLINIFNNGASLFIYDTESIKEEVKAVDIRNGDYPKFVQLPNSELFLINSIGNLEFYIVDKNYRTQKLPSVSLVYSYTCIYFNKSVYCFGSFNKTRLNNPSMFIQGSRFDLTEYRLSKLAGTEYKGRANEKFESVTFNSNILISNLNNSNLLLYSVDIDSFSEIPYKFSKGEKLKIMINGEERLYLIESNGWIFESEIGDVYVWNKLARSIINDYPFQVHCSYNKGGFYISADFSQRFRTYYKFDLSQKSLTEIACYGKNWALKRLDGKIEAIKRYGQDFEFNSYHASACIQKRASLYWIVEKLQDIEYYSKSDVKKYDYYLCSKGEAYQALGRHLEALECYNESIRLEKKKSESLLNKAQVLYDLGRYHEALECYNEVIKPEVDNESYYLGKGNCLYELGRYDEAIKCYNELIKLKPENEYHYIRKADTLYRMGKNLKAVKYFNKAKQLNSDNPFYFCYLANMLNDQGEVTEAIQEFNKAYDSFSLRNNNDYYDDIDDKYKDAILIEYEDSLELLKMLCKLLESSIEFKEKIEKIKGSDIINPEILYEIEEKEKVIKEKNSQLLIRAVKCLDIERIKSIEAFEKMETVIAEHQKEIIDVVTQLPLLLPTQD